MYKTTPLVKACFVQFRNEIHKCAQDMLCTRQEIIFIDSHSMHTMLIECMHNHYIDTLYFITMYAIHLIFIKPSL